MQKRGGGEHIRQRDISLAALTIRTSGEGSEATPRSFAWKFANMSFALLEVFGEKPLDIGHHMGDVRAGGFHVLAGQNDDAVGGVALHAPGNFAQFVGQRRFLGNHQEFPWLKPERAWGEATCLQNGVQVFVRDGCDQGRNACR